jgi:hypothetical protein
LGTARLRESEIGLHNYDMRRGRVLQVFTYASRQREPEAIP